MSYSIFLFVGSVVKGKWRNLRDNFRRELSKLQTSRSGDAGGNSKKPKWAYFENMLFLRETLTARPSSGNITISEDDGEANDNPDKDCDDNIQNESHDTDEGSEKNEGINENDTFRTPASEILINKHRKSLNKNKTKKENIHEQLLRIEQKKLETFTSLSANSGDSDYHFLMSLLPIMKQLPPLKNMQMRLNIQQLFVNEQMSMQPGYGQYSNLPRQTPYTPQLSPCETFSSGSTGASQIGECSPVTTGDGPYPTAPTTAYGEGSSVNHTETNVSHFFNTFT